MNSFPTGKSITPCCFSIKWSMLGEITMILTKLYLLKYFFAFLVKKGKGQMVMVR